MSVQQATLKQLKVFEAVARQRSFTRAAEELYLTQATVYAAGEISRDALFEMLGKRLYLTDAGQELYDTCREIFGQLARFEMKVADMQGMKRGHIRLAAVSSAESIVPRLLGMLCQRYPGVEISSEFTNLEGVQERFADNLDGLYILSQPPQHLKLDKSPFLENPLVVMVPHHHTWGKQQSPITIAELMAEEFVSRERGSATREALEFLCQARDFSLSVKLELTSNEAVKQAIGGGLGVSVLSRYCLGRLTTSEAISVVPVEQFPIQLQWFVA